MGLVFSTLKILHQVDMPLFYITLNLLVHITYVLQPKQFFPGFFLKKQFGFTKARIRFYKGSWCILFLKHEIVAVLKINGNKEAISCGY